MPHFDNSLWWENDANGCSDPHLARDCKRASMKFHHFFGERQTKTSSLVLVRKATINLPKTFKNLRHMNVGDTNTSVAHFEKESAHRLLAPNGYRSWARGE